MHNHDQLGHRLLSETSVLHHRHHPHQHSPDHHHGLAGPAAHNPDAAIQNWLDSQLARWELTPEQLTHSFETAAATVLGKKPEEHALESHLLEPPPVGDQPGQRRKQEKYERNPRENHQRRAGAPAERKGTYGAGIGHWRGCLSAAK